MPHDPKACVLDALTAARSIETFCAGKDYADYESSRMLRAAVEREFEIIGEALNRLGRIDADALSRITEHRRIIGFRNVLAHGYDAVADLAVWQIVEEKLPTLMDELGCMLADDLDRPVA